jgi:hypothetical protein
MGDRAVRRAGPSTRMKWTNLQWDATATVVKSTSGVHDTCRTRDNSLTTRYGDVRGESNTV